jgi:hypothetical protein
LQIRYGIDVAFDLAQPTTILTMMDVQSDFQRCVAEETELELAPSGSLLQRLSWLHWRAA